MPDRHLARVEVAVAFRDEHQLAAARVEHCIGWHCEPAAERHGQIHRGEHAGPEPSAWIRQLEPYGDGTRLLVELRRDEDHAAVECLTGIGLERERAALSDAH